MANDYTEDAAEALEAIREAGTTVAITRHNSVLNPATGVLSSSSVQSGVLDVIVLPATKTRVGDFDNGLLENMVLSKVRFLLVAASSAPFEPKATDLITLGGEVFSVLGCAPLAPAGLPILYKMIIQISDVGDDAAALLATWAEMTELAWQDLTDTSWQDLVGSVPSSSWSGLTTSWEEMTGTAWQALT